MQAVSPEQEERAQKQGEDGQNVAAHAGGLGGDSVVRMVESNCGTTRARRVYFFAATRHEAFLWSVHSIIGVQAINGRAGKA